jgi:hypothetical protein
MVVVLLQTLLGILRTELTSFRRSEDKSEPEPNLLNDPKSLSGLIRKVKGSISKSDSAPPEAIGDDSGGPSESMTAPAPQP